MGCFGRISSGLGFLYPVSYRKSIPTHEKLFAVGKSRPNANLFNLFFLGLGWPWVGEFVGFVKNIYTLSNLTEFGKSQTP